MNSKKLIRELKAAGARGKDVVELTDLAVDLRSKKLPDLSKQQRERIASRLPVSVEQQGRSHTLQLLLAGGAAFAVLLVAVVSFAQSAPPSSPLYKIKQGTDYLRGLVSRGGSEETGKPNAAESVDDMDQSVPAEQSQLPQIEEPTKKREQRDKDDNSRRRQQQDDDDRSRKKQNRTNNRNNYRRSWRFDGGRR